MITLYKTVNKKEAVSAFEAMFEPVVDIKTGEQYDPVDEWEKLIAEPWFAAQMRRMKDM